jgi:caspase domain-containing protein
MTHPAQHRDWWDKAGIISSILSSVVIAVIGIYVSTLFQESQLAVTKENNKAQLEMAAQKEQSDLRLQELKLASDLLEPLLSKDAKKRRIAALMLPATLSNHDMCQQILAALVQDSDSSVRITAMRKLGDSTTTASAKILDKAGNDTTLPEAERKFASSLATIVGMNANLPPDTAFLFASAPGQPAYESNKLRAGFFTYYLTKALTTDLESSPNSVLTVGELYRRLDVAMRSTAFEGIGMERGASENLLGFGIRPFMELSGSPDLVVAGDNGSAAGKKVALVIGASRYGNLPSLPYAVSDAEKMSEALKQLGVQVTMLTDPPRAELAAQLNRVVSALGTGDTLYFYFSGHGWSTNGENFIGGSDMKSPQTDGLSLEALKDAIRHAHPKAAFGFFDICQTEIPR